MFSFIKIAFATTLALGLTASAAPIENIKRDNSYVSPPLMLSSSHRY